MGGNLPPGLKEGAVIDTNAIANAAQSAPAVPAVFTAWNAVAIGAGAFIVGIYNHIVAAGGVKTICKNLWEGNKQ
jgi:hypothetical protein